MSSHVTDIQIKKAGSRKSRPADADLVFGTVFTDHMFLMDYSEEHGWHCPRVEPYQVLPLDPAAMSLQYGQSVFEGLKAYRGADGKIGIFRPSAHGERLVRSCERMCIPEIDPELFVRALKAVVQTDAEWVPSARGTALYLRPTVVASEPALGVRPARRFIYYVIMTPGGPVYGPDPRLKILVSDQHVRAVRGGAGFAKTGGNYGPTLYATRAAQEQGFHQVLFLDGVHREYVDELGIMNFMVRIGDEVVTPPISDTILAGVTRDSVLTLLRDWGLSVVERPVSISEIFEAGHRGRLMEAWATGTGAGIAAIGELSYRGERLVINAGESGALTRKIDATLTGIRYGESEDPHGWMEWL
jgi:branched-chain amino acid aminotransferase